MLTDTINACVIVPGTMDSGVGFKTTMLTHLVGLATELEEL